MDPSTPRFHDDFFFYRWIRNSCPALFGTGKMVRHMETYEHVGWDFEGNIDIERYSRTYGTD